jgi:thioredoxin-related protein
LFAGSATYAESFDDSAVKHIEYPGWFVEAPFLDLQAALDTATEAGKKGLMVFFTTEGCSYCDRFIHTSLADKQLVSALQGDFASIGLEIFSDREMTTPGGEVLPVKAFAKQQGVMFSPTLLFFDVDGKRMLRLVGYQSPQRFAGILRYLGEGHYRSVSLADYLAPQAEQANGSKKNSAVLRADPLFASPPYALQRNRFAAERPLLVLFEKRGCRECEAFHDDVLAVEGIRELLQRFEIVRLNAADSNTPVITPQGHRSNPAAWYRQAAFSRLPALVFFDEHGNEVLNTDALVLRQRMQNSLYYVLERAYEKGWSYQRFARARAIEQRRGAASRSAEKGNP